MGKDLTVRKCAVQFPETDSFPPWDMDWYIWITFFICKQALCFVTGVWIIMSHLSY
jgi:hypothetical protein